MLKKNSDNTKGQIWVETAIYTLIGLSILGIILSIANPQIEKIKDKGVITQTINALNDIDTKISETSQAQGNVRIVYVKISKGRLEINRENDVIEYILDNTRLKVSEIGEKIKEGDITLETEKYGDRYNILMYLNYSGKINITINRNEKPMILHSGTSPYQINIANLGIVNNNVNIDFSSS